MRVIIRDVPWQLKFRKRIIHEDEEVDGLCEPDTKTIWIRRGLPPERLMQVLHHEFGHATNWDHDESVIDGDSREFQRLAWQCGFRLVEQ